MADSRIHGICTAHQNKPPSLSTDGSNWLTAGQDLLTRVKLID